MQAQIFRYNALDALQLVSMEDEYFHCESCNGELVAESDKLASQEVGDGDDNARRRRREKLKDLLQKMEVCLVYFSFFMFSCNNYLRILLFPLCFLECDMWCSMTYICQYEKCKETFKRVNYLKFKEIYFQTVVARHCPYCFAHGSFMIHLAHLNRCVVDMILLRASNTHVDDWASKALQSLDICRVSLLALVNSRMTLLVFSLATTDFC